MNSLTLWEMVTYIMHPILAVIKKRLNYINIMGSHSNIDNIAPYHFIEKQSWSRLVVIFG